MSQRPGLHQDKEWTDEIWLVRPAPVNDDTNSDDCATTIPHDVDWFLNTAVTRDDLPSRR
jgi:hypothetical protein